LRSAPRLRLLSEGSQRGLRALHHESRESLSQATPSHHRGLLPALGAPTSLAKASIKSSYALAISMGELSSPCSNIASH
jgi:hypothetical protein